MRNFKKGLFFQLLKKEVMQNHFNVKSVDVFNVEQIFSVHFLTSNFNLVN